MKKAFLLSICLAVFLSEAQGSSIKAGFLLGGDGLADVVEAVGKARESIDFGLFYLTHDAIIEARE